MDNEVVVGPVSVEPATLQGDLADILASAVVSTGSTLSSTSYVIDQAQRPVVKIAAALHSGNADATVKTWYTAGGRLAQTQDPFGRTTLFRHDPQGRMQRTELPGGHHVEQAYQGLLPTVRTTTLVATTGGGIPPPPGAAPKPLSLIERTDYDPLGRATTVASPEVTVRFAYTSGGQSRCQSTPLARTRTDLEYDPLGRLVSTTITGPQPLDASAKLIVAPSPDTPTVIRGITTETHYDFNDNVSWRKDSVGRQFSFAYDGRDAVTDVTSPIGTETFERRPDGAVSRLRRDGQVTAVYSYTARGLVSGIEFAPR
jgi:YD repeat-containing protein